MTNTNLFKATTVLKGKTMRSVSKECGINNQSLSLKVNNHREFTQKEIGRVSKFLGLTAEETVAIFLAGDDDER